MVRMIVGSHLRTVKHLIGVSVFLGDCMNLTVSVLFLIVLISLALPLWTFYHRLLEA